MLEIAIRFALGLLLSLPLRQPKPSPRPAGTHVIHSGNVDYQPSDDDCASECGAVDDNHEDECLELCTEER